LSRMLDEADKVGASDDTLRDLRVLVDGFMDLTRAAAAAAAPPAAMSPAPSSPGVSGPSTEARAAAPGKTAPQPYDGAAADVVPPVTIRQDIPMIPRELMRTMLMAARTATLEVLVDENGNVERATLREQLNPIYDRLLLAATRAWKYRPATKGSTPVKYLKAISIAVRERAPEPSGQPQ
jgi:hypothetical protein